MGGVNKKTIHRTGDGGYLDREVRRGLSEMPFQLRLEG